MRFGFSVSGQRTAAEAARIATLAEERRLDELWLTEDARERGIFTVAAAAASATARITVGLGVANPWTRHPMVTAMEFGALEELAPGRAVLGLGASNQRWMEVDLGIPFERPLQRLDESVSMLRTALAGEPVRLRGQAFQVDAALSFRPARRHPPLVLGVKGPRALALAAERADGVLLSILSSPAYVSWARERLGAGMPLGAYVAFASDADAVAARDRLRPAVATYLGVHGVHAITRVAGLDPELAQAFRDGWTGGTPRTDLVSDALLETFAVAGSVDDCVTGVLRFRDAGLDAFLARDDGRSDPLRLLDDVVAVRAAAGLENASGSAGWVAPAQPPGARARTRDG